MKLMSLNLWGGRQGQKLFDYLKQESENIDIFCFQEVFHSASAPLDFNKAQLTLFKKLQELLPEFSAYFVPAYVGWVDEKKVDFEVFSGQAIFVKKVLQVLKMDAAYIYGNAGTIIASDFQNEPKVMQWAQVAAPGGAFWVLNVHGKWHPGEKLDVPERLSQSEKITETMKNLPGPKVLCGDFNLMPDTQSIAILENSGLKNLIKEFGIQNTRNEISWQQYHNMQKFADYTFVSPEIKVKSFEVPYNEVSDHLPMVLEFQL